jgi:hypothetical protein
MQLVFVLKRGLGKSSILVKEEKPKQVRSSKPETLYRIYKSYVLWQYNIRIERLLQKYLHIALKIGGDQFYILG